MHNKKLGTPALIDAVDVATLLGCSRRTVERRVAEGVFPVVKIPGSRLVRFRPSAVAEVLQKFESFCSPFDDGPGKVAA